MGLGSVVSAESNPALCNEDTAKDRRKEDVTEDLCRFSIKISKRYIQYRDLIQKS